MLAQKAFRIEIGPGAERDLRILPASIQGNVVSEIQRRVKLEPFREIKTRIKRLTGIMPPLYRLTVGDYRTYYRIANDTVVILAILHKKDTDRWLKRLR